TRVSSGSSTMTNSTRRCTSRVRSRWPRRDEHRTAASGRRRGARRRLPLVAAARLARVRHGDAHAGPVPGADDRRRAALRAVRGRGAIALEPARHRRARPCRGGARGGDDPPPARPGTGRRARGGGEVGRAARRRCRAARLVAARRPRRAGLLPRQRAADDGRRRHAVSRCAGSTVQRLPARRAGTRGDAAGRPGDRGGDRLAARRRRADAPGRERVTLGLRARTEPRPVRGVRPTRRGVTLARGRIYDNITQTVGDTPLIRLNRLGAGFPGAILVKHEGFNPFASVKDRIGNAMVEDALARGDLKPGMVIVEPTSGNTGIGLAYTAVARGFRCVITMPDTMTLERRRMLEALGVVLVLTEGAKGMKGAIARAEEILAKLGARGWMARQFDNPANAGIHYRTTGPEIWEDTGGSVDLLVSGIGTGGTITGAGRYLREKKPSIGIVAVEPAESAVLSGG